jgi:hypothetical protein
MIDKAKQMVRTKEYVEEHPPNTGDTLKAMQAVLDADFPPGTNIGVQFALQFDGRKTKGDLIGWDADRLPYGDSRSLDRRSDCSSFWENLFDIWGFGDIGTWTEGQWKKLKKRQIPWEERRPLDLIYFNFKGKKRTVSHVAGYIGGNKILHTTSKGNPLRVEKDSYGARHRVGVVRVLSDDQYESLICDGTAAGGGSTPDYSAYPVLKYRKYNSGYVKIMQKALAKKGFGVGEQGIDGDFGKDTLAALKKFQKANGLRANGICDLDDWKKLLS